MAAQILFTVQKLTPAVDEVELEAGGNALCSLTRIGPRPSPRVARCRIPSSTSSTPSTGWCGSRPPAAVRNRSGARGARQGRQGPAVGRGVARRAHGGRRRHRRQVAVRGVDGAGGIARESRADQRRCDGPRPADRAELGRAGRPVGGRPQSPRRSGCCCCEQGAGEPLEVEVPGLDGRIKAFGWPRTGCGSRWWWRRAVSVAAHRPDRAGREVRRAAVRLGAGTALRGAGVGGGHGRLLGRRQPAGGGRPRAGGRAADAVRPGRRLGSGGAAAGGAHRRQGDGRVGGRPGR